MAAPTEYTEGEYITMKDITVQQVLVASNGKNALHDISLHEGTVIYIIPEMGGRATGTVKDIGTVVLVGYDNIDNLKPYKSPPKNKSGGRRRASKSRNSKCRRRSKFDTRRRR